MSVKSEAESSFFFTNILCFDLILADDLSESDAPVPTCRRNPIGRIIFFYLVLYKEKVVCFNTFRDDLVGPWSSCAYRSKKFDGRIIFFVYKDIEFCFNNKRDDLQESDAPVPTCRRNPIGRIIFFYFLNNFWISKSSSTSIFQSSCLLPKRSLVSCLTSAT